MVVEKNLKKKPQPSRKGKKAWRKNVDLMDIETPLLEIKNELKIGGGKLHEQSNDALFTIDKTGNEKAKSKILKIDQILQSASVIPGILSRSHPTTSNSKKIACIPSTTKTRKISKNQLAQIKKVANKLNINVPKRNTVKEKVKKSAIKEVDLWGSSKNLVEKIGINDSDKKILKKISGNEYLDDVKPVVIMKPILPKNTLTHSKTSSSTFEKHSGLSYNPSFTSHQETLSNALDQEIKRENFLNKLKKKMSYPAELETLDEEMVIDGDDGEDEEQEAENDEEMSFTKAANSDTRKTRTQRNKEKKKELKAKEEQSKKASKDFQKTFKKLSETLAQIELKQNKEAAKKPEKKITKKKLGPLNFHPLPLVSQITLSEDLSDSLRAMKPEGNIFLDRFKKIQEKGLYETRLPSSNKRRYMIKEVEVHSYKRFK